MAHSSPQPVNSVLESSENLPATRRLNESLTARRVNAEPILSHVLQQLERTTTAAAFDKGNNASGDYHVAFNDYFPTTTAYQVIMWLEITCPPVLVTVGCIGNVFVWNLLARPAFRKGEDGERRGCSSRGQPTSRAPVLEYLSALSVFSVVHLVFGRGLDWFMFVAGLPSIVEMADVTCRLWQASLGVVRHVAGWTVVGMLAERYLAERTSRSSSSDAYCVASHAKVGRLL